jgi:hypothetical protein
VTPRRIQLSRKKSWRLPENAARVARPSRWGNPLWVDHGSVVGQHWTHVRDNWGKGVFRWPEVLYSSHSNDADALDNCIRKFRILCTVSERDYPTRYEEWIAPLRGKDLACWCPLDQPCHADVLLELANGANQ